MNVDGILVNDTWGKVNFKGWTGNIKSNKWDAANARYTTSEAQQLTTGQVGLQVTDNLTMKAGYYWADVPGSSAANGMGVLNTNVGSFDSSKGWTTSVTYKFGDLTLLGDYVSSTLNNAVGLPNNPKGWAVQLSNSKGPAVFYSAVPLVNAAKPGTDAWMISYRSLDAGALPSGAGGFDTTAVANPGQPYNIFTHGTDNVNVLFLAYQNVVAKNVIASLEYQDFKIKNRALTNLADDNLDKTYMVKFEFFY